MKNCPATPFSQRNDTKLKVSSFAQKYFDTQHTYALFEHLFTLSLIITNNRFNYMILMVFSTKCIQISLLKLTLKYFKMKCFNKIDE